jgi:hypothetical protein
MVLRTTPRLLVLTLSAPILGLVGCSSSDDDTPPAPSPIDIVSLSGVVLSPEGDPLPGVVARLGTTEAVTDAAGLFFLGFAEALPADDLLVHLDPADTPVAGRFPALSIQFTLTSGDARATLPYAVVLPDLDDVAGEQVDLTTNSNGVVQNGTELGDASSDVPALSVPTGTTLTVDGDPLSGLIEVSILPVDPRELPFPIPNGLGPSGFALIDPLEASFDAPGAFVGLDVNLPNDRGFPLGTIVDIWAYDTDVHGWVNRSNQTGQRGTVIALMGGGTAIRANRVVTEGGIYTGALILNGNCDTRLQGRLLTPGGAPIVAATVALSTGQVARTDGDGEFDLPLVPAFDFDAAIDQDLCLPEGLTYRITRAAEDGGEVEGTFTLSGAGIDLNDVTDLGDLLFAEPTTGVLVGVLTGEGAMEGQQVELVGPGGTTMVEPSDSNQFFVTGLEPGFYTASFEFAFGVGAVFATAEVTAGEVGVLVLSPERGAGDSSLSVSVLLEDGSSATAPTPVAGAQVLLFGSDAASVDGLLRVTDGDGLATFEGVDGPFTVSAQALVEGDRLAASLFGLDETLFGVGDPVFALVLDGSSVADDDATLAGTVSNLPVLGGTQSLEVLVVARGDVGGERFVARAPVDGAGDYSLAVPSGQLFDLALLVLDSAAAGVDTELVTIKLIDAAAGPIDSAMSLDFDLDATPDADTLLFGDSTDLTVSGGLGTATALVLELTLPGATGIDDTRRLPLPLGTVSATGGDVALPDVDLLAAGEFGLVLRATQGAAPQTGGARAAASAPLTASATELTLALDPAPEIVIPADGSDAGAAELAEAAFDLDLGLAGPPEPGTLVALRIEATGAAIAMGVERSLWTLWLPAEELELVLPRLPLPMWVEGSSVVFTAEAWRAPGAPLDWIEFAQLAPLAAGVDLTAAGELRVGRSDANTVTVDAD